MSEPHAGHEHVAGRLSIPYVTPTGVVDIRFRALHGEDPKYLGLPAAKTHLYNVRAVPYAEDHLAICEGELDTITMHFGVGIPAVGLPGANSWKPHYRRALLDFERIFVFADGDKAGADFAKHLARELSSVIVIPMPDGEDVNSTYVKYGKQFFEEKVKNVE